MVAKDCNLKLRKNMAREEKEEEKLTDFLWNKINQVLNSVWTAASTMTLATWEVKEKTAVFG